jgi:hypothetical protein
MRRSAQDVYTHMQHTHIDVIAYMLCSIYVITDVEHHLHSSYMKERKIDKEAYS